VSVVSSSEVAVAVPLSVLVEVPVWEDVTVAVDVPVAVPVVLVVCAAAEPRAESKTTRTAN